MADRHGDLEKTGYCSDSSPVRNAKAQEGSVSTHKDGFFSAFKPHSFKRNHNARMVTEVTDLEGRPLADQPPAEPALAMKLKERHLQMIAIGGSIGTGLFVGSGSALAAGGPASLIIAYGLIGVMLFCTVHALGELAVAFPIAGAFSVYSSRFIDPAWGFAMGWNYALNWLVTLPLELVAASITVSYWPGAKDINPAAFVIIFYIVIIAINFFGVEGFGEAEFVFSIIKVVAVVGFVILGIIIAAGGFYMVSLTVVGCIVPYNDPALLNGSSHQDANASPFVIAVKNAGISVVPSIMNVVILIAVLSVGNSAVYGSSRTMAALADRGQAPKILGYIDNTGRPLVAIILASVVGLLCLIVAAGTETRVQAFNWLLAISGLSSIFTWGSICACHIRFRHAWKYNGRTLDELAFTSQPGYYGSWLGLIMNLLILAAQFWTAIWPVGYGVLSKSEVIKGFFEAYLALPIVIVFFIGFKIIKKTKFKRIQDIDITSGMRELDLPAILAEERAIMATWPWYKKVWNTIF
ncbi:hypothetical protein PZA11_000057 [Diplocarpon coronariae]